MDRKQLVILKLKPKVKQFGFNSKEIKGIAAKIADNLTSADDASDEDVNAEIDAKIEAVIPYLSLGQSFANRVIEENRRKNGANEESEEDDDDEEYDDDTSASRHAGSKKKSPKGKEKSEDVPKWAQLLSNKIETLTGEVTSLKSEKQANDRRSKLEKLLKDTGTFGSRTLKSFDKMKFENDDEFEEFISEVKEDLNAYNQERADAGLSAMGNPPSVVGQEKKEEPYSDEEIDALADY